MRRAMIVAVLMGCAAAGCEQRMASDTTRGGTAVAQPIATDTPGNVFVTMDEFQISMSSDTVRAGSVTFQVSNRGTLNHQFELEGGGSEWKTDTLPPNDTRTVTADLKPGTYVAYCPFVTPEGEHRKLGMVDSLIVR